MSAPRIDYDSALPVAAHAGEIARLIADHRVVIVAGETGSGKTTQLPKICLQAGRKRIAHTQPRRIAARSVATRIASELEVELGRFVGYQVRFTRKAGRDTQIKVMTDGVLLAELAHDRDLRRYDTIIIDEAHERSLNIDFLLGYLKQLLERRPDLRVVVTSATIDTRRFAEHFGDAPVVEVSGRTYPVEIRYAPLGERDQNEGIAEAVLELATEPGNGDILVFLSGEREIRDAAEAIGGLGLNLDVLPLYARLSAAEQQRIFEAHNTRRVVLATNVAETSITVPGIRYVVDAGTARISRYSARTKVQRLPIEPISQASANQRSGRCGRLGPGIAIRLYSEEDFGSRPEFTDPEILRTNLAMVILQMAQAGLGDIASFPFVEAPPGAQIADGLRLLDELGALKSRRRGQVSLTETGRLLAQLPVDPRLGRMLIEAARRGCLREMQIIVSGLAIPDVRERPSEHAEAADQMHRRFFAARSEVLNGDASGPKRHTVHTGTRNKSLSQSDGGDFEALLRLWHHLRHSRRRLSGNAFRRMCRDEYLNFLRVREWEDLHTQLKEICRELDLPRNDAPAPISEVLISVLSGLLSHVGLAEAAEPPRRGKRRPLREYLGARGSRFVIQPGSAVAKAPPPLVMAFELVETSRLWARTVAAITAEQVEAVAGHVLASTVSEPSWSERAGRVQAKERVSLYGVPIIASRNIDYSSRDPVAAREIFIQSALVEQRWRTRHEFFAANQRVRAEAAELGERTRRGDLMVDDQAIFDFYAARIPQGICSTASFDRWWRNSDHSLLLLSLEDLMTGDVDAANFPDTWVIEGKELPVSYIFSPGEGHDGVNIAIPVNLLNQLSGTPFSWQVPGLRAELAVELIRTLPKSIRTAFVPAPEYAVRALTWLRDKPHNLTTPFTHALGQALTALTGVNVPVEAWQPGNVPIHLQIGFTVLDQGKILGQGKDYEALKQQFRPALDKRLAKATDRRLVTGATRWVFQTIPPSLQRGSGNHKVVGYPAVVDEGDSVGLKILDTPERQRRLHAAGIRRLLVLTTPDPTRQVVGHLSSSDKLALGHSPYPKVLDLLADARLKAVDRLARDQGIDVRDEGAYHRLAESVRAATAQTMQSVVEVAARTLSARIELESTLMELAPSDPCRTDLETQIANLIFRNFISATPDPWYDRLPVYLVAAQVRLTAAKLSPSRDLALMHDVEAIEADFAALVDGEPPGALRPEVEEIAFLIEEFRVSLFAQRLKTLVPVSVKRIRRAIEAI